MTNATSSYIHLYQRAGFGLVPEDLKARAPLEASVNKIINTKSEYELKSAIAYPSDWSLLSATEKEELRKQGREESRLLGAKWLLEMSRTEAVLHEKMTLFWHNHFACFIGGRPDFGANLNNTMRRHALGNFIELTKAVAREAAMLDYLNNSQNKKASPNENFARELLELFTIGRDNYNEIDIKEAARAFTGWGHDPFGNFILRKPQHDFRTKSFMGKTGKFDGDDIIDIVCADQRTAHFLSKKMYLFFVSDTPNEEHIEEIGQVLYASGYEIKPTLTHLFTADWFYASAGEKIKSPVELTVGLMRSFAIEIEDPMALVYIQNRTGQFLFKPPNVAGWPSGRSWLDNSTLAFRMRLPALMLNSGVIAWNPTTDSDQVTDRKRKAREMSKSKAQKKIKITHNWPTSEKKWLNFEDSLIRLNLPDKRSKSANEMIRLSKKDFTSLTSTVVALPEYQLC